MPRKKAIELEQLRQYFDRPIHEAARKFDVCTTLLKKICRRHGIARWPHRKARMHRRRRGMRAALGTDREPAAQMPGKNDPLSGERAQGRGACRR
jgi:hypothetical protein